MDQIRIGKFIAESRKSRNLTQRQLADALSISDKTISKWECGKGLPDVSLMLPLCTALNITVNDLLSGERVSATDYQKKAEGNMMNLMKENEENRKKMALSIITGVITIIAVCALIVIASFLDLPVIVRIILVVFSVAVALTGIAAAAMLDIKAGYFECSQCKELFVPSMDEYVKSYHTFTKRRLTCPKCGKTGMCRHRITR
ncbi:helix-turn-helix domain-containing protein [Diplocloster agilis]|uniref:helix-turn-helix domain-containing protein n=1 Tax=Diplocloster agilis TaxID=2850323 RepID=UPI000822F120|nr:MULTISPECIES: helix-turn-helix transcriptional regulator [Lachnospiraceae]MBU9746467.1 helix-turn-helix domain-containing protein [Diplocloster agilis]MCU6737037.1 helix-turn-helix domain-containing protein [Suonthocola fibrivorans]SCJ95420.1 transcriptional repressor DicA [uncultured Clostridium sp.]